MYISNIAAVNLKGQTFDHKLTPLTMITGRNFKGKTARIDAIRLALLSYIPELGKRNSDTFDLASGGKMSVQALVHVKTFAGGEEWKYERDFWLERGSVKTSSDVGPDLNTPLMDAQAYFGLTESQRVDYVFQRTNLPPSFTGAGVLAQLQRVSLGEDHTEEHETAKQDMIALCTRHLAKTEDVRGAIDALHGVVLKEEETRWKRQAADSIGAVRVLAELKNAEESPSADRLSELENETSRMDGLLDEAGKRLGRLYQQKEEAERTAARREVLTNLLSLPEPTWPVVELKPVAPAVTINSEPASTELARLEALPEYQEKPVLLAQDKIRELDNKFAGLGGSLAASQNSMIEQEKKIHDLQSHASCPYCLSSKPGWAKAVLAKLNSELEQMQLASTETCSAMDKLKAERAALVLEFEQERYVYGKWEEIHQQAQALRTQMHVDSTTNARTLERHGQLVQRANQDYQRALQQLQDVQGQWKRERQQQREELARLEEVAAPTLLEIEEAEGLATKYQAERNGFRTRIQAATKLQQDLVRAEQAAREHRLSDARSKMAKHLRASLLGIKSEMVKTAFKTMLAFANEIIAGILPFELAYDPERNEIGRYGPAGFIPHATFSGTEKALCYVAIAAALSAEAPFRLVILDELGRLAEGLRIEVVLRMEELVQSGKIDQIIGVVPVDQEFLGGSYENWTLIHLS